MATSYGFSTYQTLIDDAIEEINEEDALSGCSPETMMKWVMQACQRITERASVQEYLTLRLIQDQEAYEFADTDTPVAGTGTVGTTQYSNTLTGTLATGTGTISTDGETVTGIGTLFATQLVVGGAFVADSQTLTVMSIQSNLECTLSGGFTSDLAAGTTFQYGNTKFSRELAIGSVVTIGANTGTVLTITDPYQVVFENFFAATNVAQAFTISRKVTEIPTKIHRVDSISRVENNFTRIVQLVTIEKLRSMQQADGSGSGYSNLYKPAVAAPHVNASGRRVLVFYPAPEIDKDVTLYGLIRIRPEFYATATVVITSNIPLDGRFDGAIREFVKMRAYSWLKNREREKYQRADFEEALRRVSQSEVMPIQRTIDTE